MKETGGTWDPTERRLYFLAADLSDQQRLAIIEYPWVLIAANSLRSNGGRAMLDMLIEGGIKVLLDSGIFWLTNEHARRHNVPMDTALSLAPAEIDGFDELRSHYVELVSAYGDVLWGYIELDQGGASNKRVTRAVLEDEGFAPIPVYHPINDGWDYFDELGENYDRICWGNVVQADTPTRVRMLATMSERRAEYPSLWIHVLGLTPNAWCHAYQLDSADSSAWLSAVRWSGYKETAMMAAVGGFDPEYLYVLGDTDPESPTSDKRSVRMAAVGATALRHCWEHWHRRCVEEGIKAP